MLEIINHEIPITQCEVRIGVSLLTGGLAGLQRSNAMHPQSSGGASLPNSKPCIPHGLS